MTTTTAAPEPNKGSNTLSEHEIAAIVQATRVPRDIVQELRGADYAEVRAKAAKLRDLMLVHPFPPARPAREQQQAALESRRREALDPAQLAAQIRAHMPGGV